MIKKVMNIPQKHTVTIFLISIVFILLSFSVSKVNYVQFLLWPFSLTFLLIIPGYTLYRNLTRTKNVDPHINLLELNTLVKVIGFSLILAFIALLLLNYIGLPYSSSFYALIVVMLTLGLFFASITLKLKNSSEATKHQSLVKEGCPVKLNYSKSLFKPLKTHLFQLLLMSTISVSAFISFNFFTFLLALPMRLLGVLFIRHSALLVILIIIMGIPLTVIFWYFLIDPTLDSFSPFFCRFKLTNREQSILYNKSAANSTLKDAILIIVMAVVVTSIPNFIQFLPPGWDTQYNLLIVDGLFMDNFEFPFPVPGRLRGSPPGVFMFMAIIRLIFQVDAITAHKIFVVLTYALNSLVIYSLLSKFEKKWFSSFITILWILSLPSLHLTWGIDSNHLGLLFSYLQFSSSLRCASK
jgi:hypothetical protein